MNRRIIVLMITLIIIIGSRIASAQTHWESKSDPPNTNGLYDARYTFKKCIIWVLKGKKEIIVDAQVPQSKPMWTVRQTVRIIRKDDGTFSVTESPMGWTSGTREGIVQNSHYDIFAHYYAKPAQDLPLDIKTMLRANAKWNIPD